jgi:hypothetical protein
MTKLRIALFGLAIVFFVIGLATGDASAVPSMPITGFENVS